MIIVTGGAGFIGSAIVQKLNQEGIDNIIIVDELGDSIKWKNLVPLSYVDYIHKNDFIDDIVNDAISYSVSAIIHMGACSATTEEDMDYLMENNTQYTKILASWCLQNDVRFIYASSAATYGNGENGFDDNEDEIQHLVPINRYAYSKQLVDIWAKENKLLDRIVGLKFFNVYGPGEAHKGSMRSVAHKAFEQINDTKTLNLFKSYHSDYADGEQKRDFIYVNDCADIVYWFLENENKNGLYNVGTGNAESWNNLASAIFKAMDTPYNVQYIEMPDHLKNQYQYFTEATVSKLRDAGYTAPFTSLENGIKDYVDFLK